MSEEERAKRDFTNFEISEQLRAETEREMRRATLEQLWQMGFNSGYEQCIQDFRLRPNRDRDTADRPEVPS